ncbi:thymidine kinase [Anaerococcus sp. NML200574]|uniref:thymidine kinase n=1 Tax=unclassified Anaerococcus TaxID=2614126 RepID=UPI002237B858|nr:MULTISPECIES: thymidine kinase [unclassified Anaerococcus]MCW6677821.1 thymidine kinase [Anaerococcus sp. NML200574]MCW6702516.1 thymidine kinase [Anaerococcus sp. NML200537]
MKKQGKLIVHTGSMFSGKTTSLWRELYRMNIANYKVVAFKPSIDDRDGDKQIVTHDNLSLDAIKVEDLNEILNYARDHEIDAIGIDELQFFPNDPSEVVDIFNKLMAMNITIVVSGLDMDYKTRPFEIIKEIMPLADELIKHHAICASCGEDAWASYRKSSDDSRIQIGAQNLYEPLCRSCYNDKMKEREKTKNQIKLNLDK